jgi:hypothetical protein
MEKVVGDGRKQGKEKRAQGHQESNLDPPSEDSGAPTPPKGQKPCFFVHHSYI